MATSQPKVCSTLFETGLSYVNIPGPPLRPLTVGQLVDENAKEFGSFECLYDVPKETRLTFKQLKNEVDLFASGLLKLGLSKGDRLGIFGTNNYQWIITFLAGAKVGIIIVPLNPGYEAPELLYALNYMSIKALVLTEPTKMQNFYEILSKAVPDIKISKDDDNNPTITSALAPHLNRILYMGNEQLNGTQLWTDVQKMGREDKDLDKMRQIAATVQFDDILHVIFTSGTTGQPKGAMISHHVQINGVLRIGNYLGLTQEDKHCLTVPLCHLFGVLVGISYLLCFGCSVVIPSPTFSPSTAISIAAKEKCIWVHGTPTMHSDMLNAPDFHLLDFSSLKRAFVTGAPSSKTLLVDMMKKYGISNVFMGYGMTETFGVAFTRYFDPPELVFQSVGYPMENIEIKIIDARGQIVPQGQTGEICSRSYSLMHGYWEDPEKTKETMDSARWYHTGDAGYFLESGHLVVAGRFKDLLIRGGENIYPKEIEDFLYQNLSEEIEEVHVFGVADERLGEVVAAWILPKPNQKQGVTMDTTYVKEACVGKISRRKVPVYIKFVKDKEEFPRTPIGKAKKNVMRQLYENELGLNKQT